MRVGPAFSWWPALIPGGLPRGIAKLLLSDGAQATATGTLRATADEAEVRGADIPLSSGP